MDFFVDEAHIKANSCYLTSDSWDDWFSFQTMYSLLYVDRNLSKHFLGTLKIGKTCLKAGGTEAATPGEVRIPGIPKAFLKLTDEFFSLGQSEDYYTLIYELVDKVGEPTIAVDILTALNDCAYNLEIFHKNIDESCMKTSLLRNVNVERVNNRYHRLAHGDAKLSVYRFKYTFPGESQPSLNFEIFPDSLPPTNLHVLIGRNGVGKTRCLQYIAHAIQKKAIIYTATKVGLTRKSTFEPEKAQYGKIEFLDTCFDDDFSSIVYASFSAFDHAYFPEEEGLTSIRQIGLRKNDANTNKTYELKGDEELADDFIKSFAKCQFGLKRTRWEKAIVELENDPMFKLIDIKGFLADSTNEWETNAKNLFGKLSSGHAIVLLTITQLVSLTEEKTLILFDEPESHLHPPLLSAFIRALSDLLINRNAVAIIATHSPVVLQEIPRSCVSILNRMGNKISVEIPEIETFGENVGTLTREVFRLEVISTGFHKRLFDVLTEADISMGGVNERFKGQLGSEAQLISRMIIASRNSKK